MRRRRSPFSGLIAPVLTAMLCLMPGCGGENERMADGGGGTGAVGMSDGSSIGAADLSVLLISIDTCRPDHIGCYGYQDIETPNIDAMATRGVRFDRAIGAAPLTLPSHSTIMTGQAPYRHRVRNNGTYQLAEEKTTLAEVLKRERYKTGAIVGAFPLDSRFGLNQGFDHYDDFFPPRKVNDSGDSAERTADDVVNLSIHWLSENKKGRFFLFVHFFDPHWKYEPPEPFRSRYPDRPYDGEISFVDQEIGRLFEALDDFGMKDRTLIVLTGDHGESLGEHGEHTHSVFVYDATIRIPLIVEWPERPSFTGAGFLRGRTVESMVRAVDIAPTVLNLVGITPLDDMEGVSLAPLMAGTETDLGLVNYSESLASLESWGWSEVRSIRTEDWKFISVPREEFYDLRADPDEKVNVLGEYPEEEKRLRALLDEKLQEDRARKSEDKKIEIDEEGRAKLEALGYVTRSKGTTGGTGDLPDPKDKIGLLQQFFDARTRLEAGDLESATNELRELFMKEPNNPEIAKGLGKALMEVDELQEAEEILLRVYQMVPNDLGLQGLFSTLAFKKGDWEGSLVILERILETDPRFENGHTRKGEALLLLGRRDEAIEEYQKELQIYPQSPTAYNGLGKVYRKMDRLDEAAKYYKKALECRSDYAEAMYNLGNLYEKLGKIDLALAHFRKSIENDPMLVEAYYNYSLLAKKLGEGQQAFELLQESVRRKPNFAKGYYGLGNLYRESNLLTKAVENYGTAIRLEPNDPDYHLNIGVAQAGLGLLGDAIQSWDRAAKLAPGTPTATTASDNIRRARAQIGGTG